MCFFIGFFAGSLGLRTFSLKVFKLFKVWKVGLGGVRFRRSGPCETSHPDSVFNPLEPPLGRESHSVRGRITGALIGLPTHEPHSIGPLAEQNSVFIG